MHIEVIYSVDVINSLCKITAINTRQKIVKACSYKKKEMTIGKLIGFGYNGILKEHPFKHCVHPPEVLLANWTLGWPGQRAVVWGGGCSPRGREVCFVPVKLAE